MLRTLGGQLSKDQGSEPTLEVVEVAYEIHKQSEALFHKIGKLLPTADHHGVDLFWKQKMLEKRRSSRVEYLVGQLGYLIDSAGVLLQILQQSKDSEAQVSRSIMP